ncbi:T9SS type A sorting domain-containing protein [Rubrivirga sp. IMCC45206]|uniref:T9SS type A sorting domain-containing protein n=1 Tax=Rubrivirga sp. IMCC45206 TaxID=3391614 RepID=UPI0039901739
MTRVYALALLLGVVAPLAAAQTSPYVLTETTGAATAERGPGPAGLPRIEPAEQIPTVSGTFPSGFDLVRFYPDGPPLPAGDVNGDGADDLVYTASDVADARTADLADRTGQTLVYFGPAETTVPDQVLFRALVPAGDLDGDGFADAYASVEGGTLIYRGSAAGYVEGDRLLDGGQPVVIEGLGRPGRASAVGDVDGDGRPDIVVTTDAGAARTRTAFEAVVVFGGGPVVDLRVEEVLLRGESPPLVLLVDTNGDGRDEIAFAEEQLPSFPTGAMLLIRIAEWDPSATAFDVSSLGPVESTFLVNDAFGLVDFDADGDLDLWVVPFLETRPVVFRNDAGSLDPDPFDLDAYPAFADLDDDGAPDFVRSLDASPPRLSVCYGPSAFDEPARSVFASTCMNGTAAGVPESVRFDPVVPGVGRAFGDLDGDGQTDLLLTPGVIPETGVQTQFGRVRVSSPGRAPAAVATLYDGAAFPASSVRRVAGLGDVSGDGIDDLAIVHAETRYGADARIEVFFGGSDLSNGPDLILRSTPISRTAGAPAAANVVGVDFDGDGVRDIAAVYPAIEDAGGDGVSSGGALIWMGGADADDVAEWVLDCAVRCRFNVSPVGLLGVGAGDLDGDGIGDAVVGGQTAFVLLGGPRPAQPESRFPDERVVRRFRDGMEILVPSSYRVDGLGDVDVDGFDDVLLCVVSSVGCEIARGGPDGLAPQALPLEVPGGLVGISATGGDFDGDGDADAALSTYVSPSAGNSLDVLYGGPGVDGRPDASTDVLTSLYGPSPFVGEVTALPDLDRDGADDLLLAANYSPVNTGAYLLSGRTFDLLASLVPPNPTVGLGADNNDVQKSTHSAVGDFDGDGVTDVVLLQSDDTNDAPEASRAYRYRLDSAVLVATDAAPGALAVSVGPNPTRSTVRLRVEGARPDRVEVGLFDVLGRRVATSEGRTDVDLNVSGLAPGLYVLRVRTDQGAVTRTVVVSR